MANPRRIKATVSAINTYGRRTYKLSFTVQKKFPRFKAGQFLHLALDDLDPSLGFWPESRVFSIAACSSDRRTVSIVYSVKGEYTRQMEAVLDLGVSVWLKAPYGSFIIADKLQENEEAVLLAGGTGISPFIPFLKQLHNGNKVSLHYAVRHSEDLLFKEDLRLATQQRNLSLYLYIEEYKDDFKLDFTEQIYKGLIKLEKLVKLNGNYAGAVYFISGPPVMISSFKTCLESLGVLRKKIIVDEWD